MVTLGEVLDVKIYNDGSSGKLNDTVKEKEKRREKKPSSAKKK
jgi:hypothetical protein